jgi:hypothetical protein
MERKSLADCLNAIPVDAAAAERAKVVKWLRVGVAGNFSLLDRLALALMVVISPHKAGLFYSRAFATRIEALAHHEGEAPSINTPEGEG